MRKKMVKKTKVGWYRKAINFFRAPPMVALYCVKSHFDFQSIILIYM